MIDWDDIERQALDPLAKELADLRERHRGDPPLDQLRAADADALPDETQQRMAAHLESSAWSRALVEGANDPDVALDATAADHLLSRIQQDATRAEHSASRQSRWAPILTFASLAALVLVAVFLWRRSVPPMQPPTTTAAPSAPSASQPAAPVFALELTKPDVKLTPSALLVRGEGGSRFVDDIAAALNAYRAGAYADAARELEAVQPKHPKSVEIPFYLGVSRLFLDDPSGAVSALESARATKEPTFAHDIEWYLAVAYERAGRTDRSRLLLESLCKGANAHSARACAAARSPR